jgi:hypothetical protein
MRCREQLFWHLCSIAGCPLPIVTRQSGGLIFKRQWSINLWSWGHYTLGSEHSVGGIALLKKNRVLGFIISETWELAGRIFPLNVSLLEGSLLLELTDSHGWRQCFTLKCQHHITLGCRVISWKNRIFSCITAETSKLFLYIRYRMVSAVAVFA